MKNILTLPECDDCRISDTLRGALERWVNDGIEPNGFGMAVLSNNLKHAAAKVDHINKPNLANIVNYCLWYLPGNCWGSPEIVQAWKYIKDIERAEKTKPPE